MVPKTRSDFEKYLVSGLNECGIQKGARLLVALSGGSDSTALLVGIKSVSDVLGINVAAAHFNHKTRDGDSDKDEAFCRYLCQRLEIEAHFGLMADGAAEGLSEASMRDARYRFLAEVAASQDSTGIVTAHTLDDQAETVLLALTRGSGLRGLTGMNVVTVRTDRENGAPLKLFRPILGIRKSDTVAYCAERGVTPREDPSNLDLGYSRNRIRHRVLPELAQINSNVVESISRMADNLREDQALIDEVVARHHAAVALSTPAELSREALRSVPNHALSRILTASFTFTAGTRVDLEQVHIRAIVEAADGSSGRSLDLPNGVRMVVDYDVIRFVRSESAETECPFPGSVSPVSVHVPGSVTMSDGSTLFISIEEAPKTFDSQDRWKAALDVDLVGSTVEVRARVDGDRFQPLGMPSSMKLQDFMVNAHIPARWRDRVPLLVSERGIAWAVGYRISEWAKLSPKSEKALIVEYTPASFTESGRAED